MTDNIRRVSGSVAIESNSKEAVALKLAEKIANYEDEKKTKNREYWLTLYRQCWKATNGSSLESTLEEK